MKISITQFFYFISTLLPAAAFLRLPSKLDHEAKLAVPSRRHAIKPTPQLQVLPRRRDVSLNGLPFPGLYPQFLQACLVNGVPAALLSVSKQQSLTPQGLLHATALGLGLWSFLGLPGWIIGVSYLILGSLVTKVKMQEKERLGIAEKRHGARGPENVWGSAATGMVCAILSAALPQYGELLKLAFVSSFASKLSDTFGSELGKAYGRTTYLITTLKLVPKGTEGAVSLEGTLAGVVGSILIAALGYFTGLLPSLSFVGIVILAAFLASTIESYIGAAYQGRLEWLSNEAVNAIMTAIGAVLSVALAIVFHAV
eukprot:gene9801-10839_t